MFLNFTKSLFFSLKLLKKFFFFFFIHISLSLSLSLSQELIKLAWWSGVCVRDFDMECVGGKALNSDLVYGSGGALL